jgi:predicted nucleic acid-binding protein
MASAYVADTNLYVVAANDDAFRLRFEEFVRNHGPLLVSAVAVAEVLIGVSDVSDHAAVIRALGAGSEIVAPIAVDWIVAGGAIARLGGESITKGRSFWNDALLAAQCARLGATLVTNNAADFRRLRRHIGVRAVPPFPTASGR